MVHVCLVYLHLTGPILDLGLKRKRATWLRRFILGVKIRCGRTENSGDFFLEYVSIEGAHN